MSGQPWRWAHLQHRWLRASSCPPRVLPAFSPLTLLVNLRALGSAAGRMESLGEVDGAGARGPVFWTRAFQEVPVNLESVKDRWAKQIPGRRASTFLLLRRSGGAPGCRLVL